MPWKHPETIRIYRSVDFGFFPDPAYCLWIAHIGLRYIAFKEMVWYKTVASDVAKSIAEESEGMRVWNTYCDPSMDIHTGADIRTIKDIFEENGVPMDVSVNNREHFAHAVHTALSEEVEPGVPRLQIYAPGCPYLIKALPLQRYDLKRPLALANNRHDHPVVGLAYFLISNSSNERRTPKSHVTPRWLRPKHVEHQFLGHDNVRHSL